MKAESFSEFPPVPEAESSVVVPPARSYTSRPLSVSASTSCSSVWKKMRSPSGVAYLKVASSLVPFGIPLPSTPVFFGPVEISFVVSLARSRS